MDNETLVWGWHEDPFRIHEERWVSVAGEYSKLVRDGGQESYDPPPDQMARRTA
jgi:hypothetical protein